MQQKNLPAEPSQPQNQEPPSLPCSKPLRFGTVWCSTAVTGTGGTGKEYALVALRSVHTNQLSLCTPLPCKPGLQYLSRTLRETRRPPCSQDQGRSRHWLPKGECSAPHVTLVMAKHNSLALSEALKGKSLLSNGNHEHASVHAYISQNPLHFPQSLAEGSDPRDSF